MISRLIADGFVVPRLDVALGRANLLIGPVGVGKTTIANGIRFAALGYVPEAGATEDATAKFVRSGSPRADVTVLIDDGRHFGRSFDPLGKSRVPNAASWLDENLTTATERAAQIADLFGRTPDEAAENLDLTGLLAKKGGDLQASLDKLLDKGDVPTEVRVARGIELWKAKLDASRRRDDLGLPLPHPPAVEAAVKAAEPDLRIRLAEGALNAIAFAGKRESDATAASRSANAARTALEKRLRELKVPAEAAKLLGERRAKAMEERTRLDEDCRVYEAAAGERAAAQRDLDTAVNAEPGAIDRLERARAGAAQIDDLKAGLDAVTDPEDPPNWVPGVVDAAAREAEAAPLRAALDAVVDGPAPALGAEVAPDPAALERADALKAEADELTARANAVAKTIVPDTAEAERSAEAAKRALESAQAQPWREVETIAGEIREEFDPNPDEDADEGSTVHAVRVWESRLLALAKTHGGDVAALERAFAEAADAKQFARDDANRAREARASEDAEEARLRTAAGEKIAESIRVRKDAEDAAKEANRLERARYAEARRDHDVAVAANNERRAAIRRDIAAVEKRYADAAAAVDTERRTAFESARDEARRVRAENQSRRGAAQARIDELATELRISERIRQDAQNAVATARARLEGLRAAQHVDVATSRTRIAELDALLTTLDAQIAAAKNADGLRDEIRKERDRCEALGAEATVWGCAEWACRRLREEDMARRAGPLQERMNRFLRAAGRTESAFVDFGVRRTDFYWSTPTGKRIFLETLSGGQKVIFKAALAYAVLMLRGPAERVLTVELAEAGDGTTNAQLLAGLDAVRDDVQVLACSCVPVAAPEGWTVHRVEAQAEETVDVAA